MKNVLLAAIVSLAATMNAQDAATTLPKNYKVELENDYVRVTSVRYGPNEKLPGHAHTALPSAYVYLTDSGPVTFRHVNGPSVVRQPVKAGTFRVFRGLQEVHEVDNPNPVATEFLRVELKTQPRDPASIRGKFERPATARPVLHFDHPQMRVSRFWVQSQQTVSIALDLHPALLIAMASHGGFTAGRLRWLGPSGTTQLRNTGTQAIDFLRIDFKTPPVR